MRRFRMDLINYERLIRLVTCVGCGQDRVGRAIGDCPLCGQPLVAVLFNPLDGARIVTPRGPYRSGQPVRRPLPAERLEEALKRFEDAPAYAVA